MPVAVSSSKCSCRTLAHDVHKLARCHLLREIRHATVYMLVGMPCLKNCSHQALALGDADQELHAVDAVLLGAAKRMRECIGMSYMRHVVFVLWFFGHVATFVVCVWQVHTVSSPPPSGAGLLPSFFGGMAYCIIHLHACCGRLSHRQAA